MKVSGFTFIKNAVKFQFPIVEAIQSILPLCDEVVVAVGDSEDETREIVLSIDSKIQVIDTVWDENQKGGGVLAAETNKAFHAVSKDSDWCFYIQGDEIVHEDEYNEITSAMHKWKDAEDVDGLLFKYRHFYGSFDYIGISSQWYKNEIRIIKNNKNIFSYKDAQGFRKNKNQKLGVKPLNAFIHHYGWVREPKAMEAKARNSRSFYHGKTGDEQIADSKDFDYSQIDALENFKGTHPLVMQEQIKNKNWKFEHNMAYNKLKPKEKFKNLIEKITGNRPFDFKNYKII
ncbi:MAG: glycosyltransferase family 2 protein [Bacteroidota bacterium]|nr:glycosyltransferase family 2 protein [Bacteroidota bacterium]